MRKIYWCLIFFVSIFASCKTDEKEKKYIASYQYQDYLNCFHEELTEYDNSPVSLELSGVTYYHDSLFIVSEQRIPGTSSFYGSPFKIPFKKNSFNPETDNNVLNAKSFEGIALSPHQKYLFAITSFADADNRFAENDTYNMLFYKRLVPPGEFKLAYKSQRNEINSSLELNSKIRKALRTKLFKKGPPYFKIGGIAAIKNNVLLIAISEIGENINNNEKVNVIVGAKYEINNDYFVFTEELKEYYRFSPEVNYNLSGPQVLTGIEYDSFNDRIYIVTSFKKGEKDVDVGGYLWILPYRDFILKKEPKLVKDEDGIPIEFAHKPGGITILDKDQIFIVFDDDRISGSENIVDGRNQFKRKLSQAYYTIMLISEE
jgi:hypothetical protein